MQVFAVYFVGETSQFPEAPMSTLLRRLIFGEDAKLSRNYERDREHSPRRDLLLNLLLLNDTLGRTLYIWNSASMTVSTCLFDAHFAESPS